MDEELEELEYIARSAPPGLPKFITTGAVLSLVAEVRRLRAIEADLRAHIAQLGRDGTEERHRVASLQAEMLRILDHPRD